MLGSELQIVGSMEKSCPTGLLMEGNSGCKDINIMRWMGIENLKQVTAIGMDGLVTSSWKADNAPNLLLYEGTQDV